MQQSHQQDKKIFISYSHKDSEFVDELVRDLNRLKIDVTYDKWILNVGDSIIQKLSIEIDESSFLIAILSESSITSNWVTKELAMAMTTEISQNKVKILPVLLSNCKLPAMLSDKLYADFRSNYFVGFRAIAKALNIDESDYYFKSLTSKEQEFDSLNQFKVLLNKGNSEEVSQYLKDRKQYLLALLGRNFRVSEAIPFSCLEGYENNFDYVIITGQSFRHWIALVKFFNVDYQSEDLDSLNKIINELEVSLNKIYDNYEDFIRKVAFHVRGAHQAGLVASRSKFNLERKPKLKILYGRREQFSEDFNYFRSIVFDRTNENIELISYDRLLDSIRISIRGY